MSPVAEVSLLDMLKSLHPALLLIICYDMRHAELPTLLITTAQLKQHEKNIWCIIVDMQVIAHLHLL